MSVQDELERLRNHVPRMKDDMLLETFAIHDHLFRTAESQAVKQTEAEAAEICKEEILKRMAS